MIFFIVSVLVLAVLIVVHEFGHFIVAKMNKVTVLEFAVGFGKTLWSKRIGETKYAIRLVPLGGFVRMAGDDPRFIEGHSQPDEQGPLSPQAEEERQFTTDRSRWFLLKSVPAKMSIVFAGPLFNLIFAVVLAFITLSMYGAVVPTDDPVLGRILPARPAQQAGFKPGDKVTSVDGVEIGSWTDLAKAIQGSNGKELSLNIERKDKQGAVSQLTLPVEPELEENDELSFLEGKESEPTYRIGIFPPTSRVSVDTLDALKYSFMHVANVSYLTLKGIGGMILGAISLNNLGGPIFIFGEAMRSAEEGLADLFDFMVFISISLAVLNLLPIPVLDGGHLLFFLIEWIRGVPVSLKFVEKAQQVGVAFLILLTVLALGNDLFRVFS